MRRREFLGTTARAVAGTALLGATGCRPGKPKWGPSAYRRPARSTVAVLAAEDYGGPLEEIVRRGIGLCGLEPRGLKVVLKPNFVEYDPHGVVNTHPAVLRAAIDAFRGLGASEVVVAEGAGHRRDNEYLLDATGIGGILRETGTRFVDLNVDVTRAVRLPTRFTDLGSLYLPESVLGADLLVSLPKLKTHHWAGVTLSLKNMFGIVPGSIYGWPKNILHWAGIGDSILDINAALRITRFNLVDGIVGMEGNGPIQGDPRHSGVLVFGADPVAVDATSARLMNIDPRQVSYLRQAGEFLGNIDPARIRQAGENPERYAQDYAVLDSFRGLKLPTRATSG